MKICTKCKIEFPATTEFFFAEKKGKFGLRSKCKKCFMADAKKTKAKPEARQKAKEYGKDHYKNNKDKYAKRWQEYYAQNANHLKEKAREYGRNNLPRRREYDRERLKNPQYRLHSNISGAIIQSLSRYNGKNGAPWQSLVGYSLSDIKIHLEKQFKDGMTWENYGDWHIDHKIPQSVFNFTKPEHEDFKRCWSLKNLQPLWAKENISKGAKLNKHFQPSLLM